jgi:hypothetical protein
MTSRILALLGLLLGAAPATAWAQAGWAGDGGRPWILRPRYDEQVSGDVVIRLRPLGVGARITILAWDVGDGGERELSGGGLDRTRSASGELRIPRGVFKGVSRAALMVCRRGGDRTDRSSCSRPVQFDLAASPHGAAAGSGPVGVIRSLRLEQPAAPAGGASVRVSGSGVCDELQLNACHQVSGSSVCTREEHRNYDLEASPALTIGASMPGLASVGAKPGPNAGSCSGKADAVVGDP